MYFQFFDESLGFGGGNDGFYGNNGGYGGGGSYGGRYGPGGPPGLAGPRFVVHMRGLPYRVTENDIAEVFFLKCYRFFGKSLSLLSKMQGFQLFIRCVKI